MIKFKTLRHALMMTAAVVGGAAVATVADRPAFAQEAVRTYAIPAQSLDGALRAFAMQTGRDVLYPPRVVAGKRSPGVQGQRTERQALEALLAGTGLRFEQTASNGYVVQDPASPTRAGEAGDLAATELEDVVVTGTNLRGGAAVGSPLVVITQADIERSGAQTAAQLLENLPQNFGGGPSLDMNSSVGSDIAAYQVQSGDISASRPDYSFGSSVNLRGLGQGTTLILVNGQRLSTAAAQESGRPYVDISSIPLSAIDRVEVLTDGASAVYGADAVGGVVNFILKRNYTGAQTRLTAGVGEDGVAPEYRAAQTVGFGWADGNALLNLEHYQREATRAEGLWAGTSTSGGILTGDITPDEQSDAINLSVWQNLSPTVRVFADGAYSRRKTNTVQNYFLDYDLIYPGAGFGTQTVDVAKESRNRRHSLNAGAEMDFGGSWSGRFTAGLSKDDFNDVQDNHQVIPAFGSDDYSTVVQSAESELVTLDAVANGEIVNLPGGALRAAVGAQHRAESFDFSSSVNGAPSANSQQHPPTVTTDALFAELEAPIMRALGDNRTPFLTLSAAVRYEDYSNFGDTLNPRYGLRFAPNDDLSVRASYSTSFKPPSTQQLRPNATYFNAWDNDPREADGYLRTLRIFGSGNPDLQPETSEAYTVGLDWNLRRLGDLEVHLTAYDIEYVNRIHSLSAYNLAQFDDPGYDPVRVRRGDIPDAEFNAIVAAAFANPYGAQFGGCNAPPPPLFAPFIFGPCSENVANIEGIVYQGVLNLAGSHDRGLDIGLKQDFDTAWGRFDWSLNATYIFDHEQQITSNASMVDHVDELYYPIDLNVRAVLGWKSGGWSVHSIIDYADAYENTLFTPSREIDAYTTVDLDLRYDTGDRFGSGVLNGVSVLFHVTNAFNESPPYVENPADFGRFVPYDPTNANLDLRRFSLTLVKEW